MCAAELPRERRKRVVRCFSEMCQEVILGQYLEMTALASGLT